MVLLIEDNETTREITAAVLQHAGYRVCTAANGQEALVSLRGARPDVILSDLDMPVLDGWALRKVLLASTVWRTIPFVVVSAVVDAGDEAKLDAAMVLRKPVAADELLACVAQFDAPSTR